MGPEWWRDGQYCGKASRFKKKREYLLKGLFLGLSYILTRMNSAHYPHVALFFAFSVVLQWFVCFSLT